MGAKNCQKRVAAFFDLDLTITDRDSFRYFLRVQYLHNLRNWHLATQVFFYGMMRKLRLISLQTFKEKALLSLRQKSENDIKKVGKAFLETHLVDIIRKEALKKIHWHKNRGHLIFMISSCPDIYISPLAEYLRCDGYECSRLAYRDKKFIGKFDGNDCLGTEKVERLKSIAKNRGLALTDSYAYSDHESDLPLLELVGNPIAVTPAGELRRIAVDRGWRIEEW